MRSMIKDSGQVTKRTKQFKLGHLGTLNQVIVALGKTIRAMADGSVDSQVGFGLPMAWGSCGSAWRLGRWTSSGNDWTRSRAQGGIWHDKQSHDSRRALRTWRSDARLVAAL